MLSCMRYTRWHIMEKYFIILLTCWMSNRNIVCPGLRKLPGLATSNMQHISPACLEFINLGFAIPCVIIRWFRGRADHDQQHCYHQAPTVNQMPLLQLLQLLMMGMRMPETCWAVFKRQVINLRSCCILFVDSVENMQHFDLNCPEVEPDINVT